MKRASILMALLTVGILSPLSELRASAAADAIVKAVDRNLAPESYEAYRRLINEEPDGRRKEYEFFTLKKGKDKLALLYLSPAIEKGRATLRLGENMWLYIPNVNRPVRITSLQSVVGGVFNNADIMNLDYSAEYSAELASETATEQVLDLKAKTSSVAYDRLKMWVSKKDQMLRKVECRGASGMLIKTLEFKEDKDFGGGLVRPSVIETHSPLFKGYRSYIIYKKIRARSIPDEAFTQTYMGRLGDLR
jgi:outer membrane lipoprotein-sorting protein